MHSANCWYFHFCRRARVLAHAHILDPRAAQDPETDLAPGHALVRDQGATAPNRGPIPGQGLGHHDASHIPSHTPGQSRVQSHAQSLALAQDHHQNPSPDLDHVLDHGHQEMKKRHLLNLKPARIIIRIQQMVKQSQNKVMRLLILFCMVQHACNSVI